MSDAVAAQLASTIASKLGESLAKAFVNSITGADISDAKLKAFWDNLDPAAAVIQVIDGAIFGNVMEELVYDVVIPAALKAKWPGIAIAKMALVIGTKGGKKAGNLKQVFAALVTNYQVNGRFCLPRNKVCFCKSAPAVAISSASKPCPGKSSGAPLFGGNTGVFLLAAVVLVMAVN